MDGPKFAEALRYAIVGGWQQFRQQYAAETPYAFVLIGGQSANYLGYAVATEEGLRRVAAEYDRRGYRYQGWDWEEFDNCAKLTLWLRWANPDDGWHYGDFPERFRVQSQLDESVASGVFGDDAGEFEELCTNVLASLQNLPAWQEQVVGGRVVVGFTYGEDPRDFLRTATRANPYPMVRQLWTEYRQADELASRIKSPGQSRV